jgi:hypothetical protein
MKYLQAPMTADLLENWQHIAKKFMRCHKHVLAFACPKLQCPLVSQADAHSSRVSKIEWVNTLLD